jgi:hypothetical protein
MHAPRHFVDREPPISDTSNLGLQNSRPAWRLYAMWAWRPRYAIPGRRMRMRNRVLWVTSLVMFAGAAERRCERRHLYVGRCLRSGQHKQSRSSRRRLGDPCGARDCAEVAFTRRCRTGGTAPGGSTGARRAGTSVAGRGRSRGEMPPGRWNIFRHRRLPPRNTAAIGCPRPCSTQTRRQLPTTAGAILVAGLWRRVLAGLLRAERRLRPSTYFRHFHPGHGGRPPSLRTSRCAWLAAVERAERPTHDRIARDARRSRISSRVQSRFRRPANRSTLALLVDNR